MSKPVQLYCWHFMSYPYLPTDFDERYETGWVTVPNRLLIWGNEDRLVPRAHAEAYRAGLPGAHDSILIADAGHSAPLEQPDAVADAVLGLLAAPAPAGSERSVR